MDEKIKEIERRLESYYPKLDMIESMRYLLWEVEQERGRLSKLLIEARVEIVKLQEGIRKVLSSRIWGHQHWDTSGWCGAGCEICQEQFKVRKELYELVEGGQKDEVSKL